MFVIMVRDKDLAADEIILFLRFSLFLWSWNQDDIDLLSRFPEYELREVLLSIIIFLLFCLQMTTHNRVLLFLSCSGWHLDRLSLAIFTNYVNLLVLSLL